MDKVTFLKELGTELAELAPEVRQTALGYCEEYFAGLNSKEEARVLESLGSPMRLAHAYIEAANKMAEEETENEVSAPYVASNSNEDIDYFVTGVLGSAFNNKTEIKSTRPIFRPAPQAEISESVESDDAETKKLTTPPVATTQPHSPTLQPVPRAQETSKPLQPFNANEPAPAAVQQPFKANEPAPAAVQQPFKANEPAPAAVQQPFKANEPAPAAVQQPFKANEPAPAAAQQPFKANEPAPAAAQQPFKANEPAPDAAQQPFKANEPAPDAAQNVADEPSTNSNEKKDGVIYTLGGEIKPQSTPDTNAKNADKPLTKKELGVYSYTSENLSGALGTGRLRTEELPESQVEYAPVSDKTLPMIILLSAFTIVLLVAGVLALSFGIKIAYLGALHLAPSAPRGMASLGFGTVIGGIGVTGIGFAGWIFSLNLKNNIKPFFEKKKAEKENTLLQDTILPKGEANSDL